MRSDESLYEELLGGDLGAFDALYERYERPLFGFIRRYVPAAADAEEIAAEAFMAVLRHGRGGGELSRFKPWIYRVARNLCLNHIRSRGRADRALAALARDPAQSDDGPDRALADAEIARALDQAVAKLPEHLGEVYTLRAAGMSYEHVAAELGIPIGTVKSRVNSMLKRLREEMNP